MTRANVLHSSHSVYVFYRSKFFRATLDWRFSDKVIVQERWGFRDGEVLLLESWGKTRFSSRKRRCWEVLYDRDVAKWFDSKEAALLVLVKETKANRRAAEERLKHPSREPEDDLKYYDSLLEKLSKALSACTQKKSKSSESPKPPSSTTKSNAGSKASAARKKPSSGTTGRKPRKGRASSTSPGAAATSASSQD